MALTRHLTAGQLVRSGPRSPGAGASRDIKQWRVLAAICIATFVVLTDFMAVGVALPAVQRSFAISFAGLQWVVEAFVLPLTVGVLAAGHATVRFGSRRVFLTSLIVLACGSLLGALAPSADVLIAGRAVQGIGGAMLLTTGAPLLAEIFWGAYARLGVVVWGAVTAVAVGLSPFLGGAIDSWLGWRWIFGLASIACVLAIVLGRKSTGPLSLDSTTVVGTDWRGLTLFTAGTVILVVGLIATTTTLGGWSQSGVLACFACSGLLFVAFVAVEAVSQHPVLDVNLFRRRNFAGSAAAAFGLSASVLGPFVFLVLFLSYSLGYSTLNIGGHLLLLSGMTIVLLPLAGVLDRYVPVKAIICAGLVLVALGLWLMSRLSSKAGWEDLVPGLILAGVGLELVSPRLASTAASVAAAEDGSAIAAARANTAMRQLGTATGVAVFGSVFAARLTDELSSRLSTLGELTGQGPQIAGLVLAGRSGAAIHAAPMAARPGLYSAVQVSFATAMHDVLLVSSAVALISGLMSLSIRSRDVPSREWALAGSIRTGLATSGRARAQLVPGSRAGGKPFRDEVARPPVVHVEVVHAEVAPPHVAPPHVDAADVARSQTEPPQIEPAELDPLDQLEMPATINTPARNGLHEPSAPDPGYTGPSAVDLPGADVLLPLLDGVNGTEPDDAHPRADQLNVPVLADRPHTEAVRGGDAGSGAGPVNTGSLAVRVTRAHDGLLLKAELTIVGSTAEVIARHWTGTDGEFIVPALPIGNYEVVVQKLGYRPGTALVVVAPGVRHNVELALVGMAHIYGAVEGPGGGWLPGVLLTLTDMSGFVVATTKTDAAGSYHFPRVPEGSYTVSAPAYFGATSAVEIGAGSAVAADVLFGSSRAGQLTEPPEKGPGEPPRGLGPTSGCGPVLLGQDVSALQKLASTGEGDDG